MKQPSSVVPSTVAEAYLATLANLGIDFLFSNAGTLPIHWGQEMRDQGALVRERALDVVRRERRQALVQVRIPLG